MIDRDDLPYYALIGLVIVALFMLAMNKAARAHDERQIRRDCTKDALRYCTYESLICLKRETPQCRADVIACMKRNQSKLQAKCSRHLY